MQFYMILGCIATGHVESSMSIQCSRQSVKMVTIAEGLEGCRRSTRTMSSGAWTVSCANGRPENGQRS